VKSLGWGFFGPDPPCEDAGPIDKLVRYKLKKDIQALPGC